MKTKQRPKRPNALLSAFQELKATKEAEQPLLPDFGTALVRCGLASDECLMLPYPVTISKMTTMHYANAELYTTEAVMDIDGTHFMASIDMLPYHVSCIIHALLVLGEDLAAQNLAPILDEDQEQVHFPETPITLMLSIFLGKKEESIIGECFIPIKILEVNGVAVEK